MESASEGLTLLLDMLEPESPPEDIKDPALFRNLFLSQKVETLWCKNCHKNRSPLPDSRSSGTISVKEDQGVITYLFDAAEEDIGPVKFAKQLDFRIEKLGDYKCEKCAKDKKEAAPLPESAVYQLTQLHWAPSIFVLCFNLYGQHKKHYYPTRFSIPASDGGELHYRIVATVNHGGTLSTGHYWCRAKRWTPGSGTNMIHRFDDNNSPVVTSIHPDKSVYMVFYHRCEADDGADSRSQSPNDPPPQSEPKAEKPITPGDQGGGDAPPPTAAPPSPEAGQPTQAGEA